MIRILHVLGGLERGGAETMIMNLYRNIDRETVQFDFVIHTQEKQAYYEEILALGGRIYHFPTFNGRNLFLLKKLWNGFFEDHPEYKILHSHVRSYASIYFRIAKKYGLKLIIHSHSTSNGKGLASAVKYMLQFPLRFQADYLMACSYESGKWLFGKKACTTDKFVLLRNGIELKKFYLNHEIRLDYRRKMFLDDKIVFVHVGRLHPAKNHMFLLDIFSKIENKNSDAVLLIVGSGELEAEINDKIQELGLNDKVRMLGSRGDINNILMASDCFLFPSLWEGVPLTVIEAQAAGLPCLVSEKITDDICLSELVCKLPIDCGTLPWVKTIESMSFERKNVSESIRSAGYDISNIAYWLENFYYSMLNKE